MCVCVCVCVCAGGIKRKPAIEESQALFLANYSSSLVSPGLLSIQEYEKAHRKKRDEQEKWEDLNLRQPSEDDRRPSAISLPAPPII